MAINVTLLTFNKRENSTKKPTAAQIAGGSELSCILIDNTSLMNPTFKFDVSGNPVGYNYCYVPAFERYFFINDWSSNQGFWYATCSCDVLASWKTEIGTGSHYILRSASDYDEYISDPYYGAKITETAVRLPQSGALYWNTNHSYVVGITGYAPSTDQQVGSVTYYQMDDVGLYNFIYYLMHDIQDWCDIPTAQYDPSVQEALLNPIQYIVSCIALPVGFPVSYTQTTRIHFGYYYFDIPGTGKYRTIKLGETATETDTITLPKHPQAATRGKYMNAAPFSTYTFHLGPFGDIPLDPADYIDAENLRYKITYDICQGVGRLVVGPAITGNTNITNVSYCASVQVGAPVQLAQAIIDPLKAELSWETGMNSVIATGVGSGLSTGTLSNFLNAQNVLQQTYADAIRNRYPTVSGKGTPGSFFSFFDADYGCYLLYKYFTVVDEDLAENGRPLCQVRTLNTLSGYAVCQNAECVIPGTHEESAAVNGYLNSGFFWE